MAFLIALGMLVGGGVMPWILTQRERTALKLGSGLTAAGALLALIVVLSGSSPVIEGSWVAQCPWILWDWNSRFFQIPIWVTALVGAVAAAGYLAHDREMKGRAASFFGLFNLTVLAMLGVTVSASPVLFLICWELMGAASAGLVAFYGKWKRSYHAVWFYLLACQVGGLALVLVVGHTMNGAAALPGSVLAMLAVIGAFGIKAGFPGVHNYLWESYPVTPAPAAVLLAGGMINLWVLGVFRFGAGWTDETAMTAGWILLCCGIAGSLYGSLFATAQKELRRLIACSSVENMGIVAMGMALMLLLSDGMPGREVRMESPFVLLAGAGVAVHLINHMFFKSGLFLAAGSVALATGNVTEIDRLGGLFRRMPRTGRHFLFHALGISAVPPFSGFWGEFLIYLAAFGGLLETSGTVWVGCFAVIVTLALTGGLAVTAFVKAFGGVFLGEPRSREAAEAMEVPKLVSAGSLILIVGNLLFFFGMIGFAGYTIFHYDADPVAMTVWKVGTLSLIVWCVFLALLLWRKLLLGKRHVTHTITWDCAYVEPTARMEYNGSAFVQPLNDFFAPLLGTARRAEPPQVLFPQKTMTLEYESQDFAARWLWTPVQKLLAVSADRIHRLQSGLLHFYILIMVVALLAMMVWGMFFHEVASPETPALESAPAVEQELDENMEENAERTREGVEQ